MPRLLLTATLLFLIPTLTRAADAPEISKPTADLASAAPDAEGDYKIGPKYVDAPELKPKEGVPRGELKEFTMNSADSKIYPGIAKNKPGVTPYARKVWV